MKYTINLSVIKAIGYIWQPNVGVCSMAYQLTPYDINNIQEQLPTIPSKCTQEEIKESMEHWLRLHGGDFQTILDFEYDIEFDDGTNAVGTWTKEDSYNTYLDTLEN